MKTSGYYEQEYASKREVIDIATEIATEIVNNADEIEGKVLTFANLPLASSQTDKIWLVEQSSGVWLVNYKQAGLYKSDGTNWNLLDSTSDIVNTLNNKADKLTTITAGTGLAGGGDLSINRTISHSDTSSQADVTNSDGSVIQSITLDTFGHIQTISSTNLDTRYDGRYASLNGAYANPTWITSLNANKLIGTIPSNVLSGSTLYIGTTAIALNRASGNQALTGISSVQFTGATSGTATIQAPAIAGTTTFTLPATSGNLIGSGDVGSVSNTMLAGSIADSKLNTITTAGKVANSSTTATNLNTASSIVARDASGNFSAGTITGALNGNSTTATTLQTARTINGVSFNGSANITITANTPNALTIASPLTGSSFNGGTAVSIGIQTATSLLSGALSSTDWITFNTAYNRSPTQLSVTGTTTKTITLTKQDGTTLTANWSDLTGATVTSVFGRSGAVSAAEGDYSLDLLGDVIITSPATDQLLKYNGTNWANWTANYLTLSSLSASSPLSYNNTTGQFSITQATTSSNGFLSSTDWNTFNNKIGASGGTLTGQLISTRANNAGTGQGQLYLNGATGNRIDFNINGVAAPSFGTRSAGTKIVLYPSIGASSADFAIGIEGSTFWQSVNNASSLFKWYGGQTLVASLDGVGNLGIGGRFSTTATGSTNTGGGQLYLNGATSNRIDFNQQGIAAPTFGTRSVGTKIVLYPALGASSTDYALGIEDATLWQSIPGTGNIFKWYAGTTHIATLSGTGLFRNHGTFQCGASDTDSVGAALQIYSDGTVISIEARQGNDNNQKRNIAIAKYGGSVGIGKNPAHSLDVNGNIQASGTLLVPQLTASATQNNFNTVKPPGLYEYDGGLSNTPPDNTLNYRTVEIGHGGRYTQVAFSWDTERAFFRNQLNSNFNDWREFVTSQNRSQYTTGKTSASSGNGYCVYDNVAVLVGDNSGGKWIYVSAATATNLNGGYSLTYALPNNTNGRAGYILNLNSSTNQLMGNAGDNFNDIGHVIGMITDTNVNRVYRFSWQFVSGVYQNVIIERLH